MIEERQQTNKFAIPWSCASNPMYVVAMYWGVYKDRDSKEIYTHIHQKFRYQIVYTIDQQISEDLIIKTWAFVQKINMM